MMAGTPKLVREYQLPYKLAGAPKSLYRWEQQPTRKFLVMKFDKNFNLQASYETSERNCTCPARVRCKHMDLVEAVRGSGVRALDNNEFWDLDNSRLVTARQIKKAA
jgi:hypothetical protein